MLKLFTGLIRRCSQMTPTKTQLSAKKLNCDDNKFETFHRVCDEIAAESSYLQKVKKLQHFFDKGINGDGFSGDKLLWVQLLIPGASQRVYNLQNKALLKLFSRIFNADQQQMQLDLEQDGDISETLRKHFAASTNLKPQVESKLYIHEVERMLIELEQRTKEDEQTKLLRELCQQSNELDLKTFIRLVKQDLRINARARHILDAFGPLAYTAYQSSRDLASIVQQFGSNTSAGAKQQPAKVAAKQQKAQKTTIQVMTPIAPMLANACKSVEEAFKTSPTGMYSEIKYDGERVQIHKQGDDFKFFSRNMKPVMEHKIKRLKDYIPKAFPGAGDLILDAEIILVDTITGKLLPFGTLGAHKKQEHENAAVCLFVFDCILYEGDDLTQMTFRARREILEENIKPIKSYVQLSESQFITTPSELSMMTAKVLQANLEGVVLKSPNGTYEPGKRRWLKVKKDYLFGGKMADTADLVVLGAWYGSGKKGGVLSIFLMGCYDTRDRLWKTVTKVHSGLDDATNAEIHDTLLTLTERADANKTPNWLYCKKSLVPDVLAKMPNQMPVWEITGAEFTKSEAHTASGISIRFPRITRLRSDKSAKEANDLIHLENLFEASKQNVNVDLLLANCGDIKVQLEKTPVKTSPLKKEMSSGSGSSSKKTDSRKRTRTEEPSEEESQSVSPKKRSGKKMPKMEETKSSSQKNLNDFFKPTTMTGVTTKPTTSTEVTIKPSIAAATAKNKMVVENEPKNELIFTGRIGFFAPGAALPEHMDAFKKNGGILTLNTKKANVVFYTSIIMPNLDKLRISYNRDSRHLTVDWIHKSLEAKACEPYPMYALVLKPKTS